MNVHTTFIEPGFNVGVTRKPSCINLVITFTKGNSAIAVVEITKELGGNAFDYDTGYRISDAYARAGKALGAYLKKSLK